MGSWGKPVRTTRPPGLTISRECATASAVPAVSITTSTPSRFANRRATASSGPSVGDMRRLGAELVGPAQIGEPFG